VTTAHGSGYVAAGYAEAYDNANDVDMYVVKTDPSGNLIWEHTYGR
jgi:hypothetical protein